MDLYDDIDDTKPRPTQVDGWSSGIKMLQTQLVIKHKTKEQIKRPGLTPVVRAKKTTTTTTTQSTQNLIQNNKPLSVNVNESGGSGDPLPQMLFKPMITNKPLEPILPIHTNATDEWDFVDEYDPQWPNEYEKLKEKHQSKDRSSSGRAGIIGGNMRSTNEDRKRLRGGRNGGGDSLRESPPTKFNAFGSAHRQFGSMGGGNPIADDDYSPPSSSSSSKSGGAAIAPPPSLQEISINNESGDGSSNVTIPYSASSVAAKIMAKYGFRDGQGLGKLEQGMSMALQVEKTSKRGGRIIHEKDVFLPPPSAVPSSTGGDDSDCTSPIPGPMAPPPAPVSTTATTTTTIPIEMSPPSMSGEPSITEIMKDPSKVVLLRNMVGPGEVDEELQPEVKDECNTKYGDVTSVLIHEAFGTTPEDAVKIFVEFKRIESAIKAVVDLNGRFFGGRQVRAGFYNYDKFRSFQLH